MPVLSIWAWHRSIEVKLYLSVEHLDALDAEETAGKSRQTACPLGVGIDRGNIRCKKGLGL